MSFAKDLHAEIKMDEGFRGEGSFRGLYVGMDDDWVVEERDDGVPRFILEAYKAGAATSPWEMRPEEVEKLRDACDEYLRRVNKTEPLALVKPSTPSPMRPFPS
jgi:hypothetical protein